MSTLTKLLALSAGIIVGAEIAAYYRERSGAIGSLKATLRDDGVTVIKDGRKTIAKIINREVFYKAHNLPQRYSDKYPYSLEIGEGIRECASLDECSYYMEKYTGIRL